MGHGSWAKHTDSWLPMTRCIFIAQDAHGSLHIAESMQRKAHIYRHHAARGSAYTYMYM